MALIWEVDYHFANYNFINTLDVFALNNVLPEGWNSRLLFEIQGLSANYSWWNRSRSHIIHHVMPFDIIHDETRDDLE